MAHSTLFQELKQVDEKIKTVYSTAQLLKTLDELLYRAVYPIIENTSFMDTFLANVIPWIYYEGRRKISPLKRERVMTLLLFYLVSNDSGEKKKILRKLSIERNLIIDAVTLFLSITDKYVKCVNQYPKATEFQRYRLSAEMAQTLRIVGANNSVDLYLVNRDIRVWLQYTLEFKNQIQEKYIRHALMLANAHIKSTNSQIDLDDLIQNFLMAISKAIDKCSANHGTLTTYINHWLRNAVTSGKSIHEYGIAYRIPSLEKRRHVAGKAINSNISIPLDALADVAVSGPESHVIRMSEIQRLRLLAKFADPYGVGRRMLGIDEILTERELALLETVTVKEY